MDQTIQEMNTSFETFISSIISKIFNLKCDWKRVTNAHILVELLKSPFIDDDSEALNWKSTIRYVSIVPKVPTKVLRDKVNTEHGVMGDSQWYRNSCLNNCISLEQISVLWISNRSKWYAHFFIFAANLCPPSVTPIRRTMVKRDTHKQALDSKRKSGLNNTVLELYNVMVDIKTPKKYVFIIIPDKDLLIFFTPSISINPMATNVVSSTPLVCSARGLICFTFLVTQTMSRSVIAFAWSLYSLKFQITTWNFRYLIVFIQQGAHVFKKTTVEFTLNDLALVPGP